MPPTKSLTIQEALKVRLLNHSRSRISWNRAKADAVKRGVNTGKFDKGLGSALDDLEKLVISAKSVSGPAADYGRALDKYEGKVAAICRAYEGQAVKQAGSKATPVEVGWDLFASAIASVASSAQSDVRRAKQAKQDADKAKAKAKG